MFGIDHPLFWLAIATFIIVLGVAVWSYTSTKRKQKHGNRAQGIGGPNDPMA